jgi:hypothetical protein
MNGSDERRLAIQGDELRELRRKNPHGEIHLRVGARQNGHRSGCVYVPLVPAHGRCWPGAADVRVAAKPDLSGVHRQLSIARALAVRKARIADVHHVLPFTS